MKKVIAHGTFDILHYGHINYLEQAKKFGNHLTVLITSDELAKTYGKNPIFNEKIHKKVVSSIKYVDEVKIRNEHISKELLQKLNA